MVSSGNKPLLEPMLSQIYIDIEVMVSDVYESYPLFWLVNIRYPSWSYVTIIIILW